MRRRSPAEVTINWSHPDTDEEFLVECSVEPFVPAKIHGPPENCYPAEGGEVEILRVTTDPGGVEREDILELIQETPKFLEQVEESATLKAAEKDDEPW